MARRTDLLEEIATKIRATGGTALVFTTDNSKPEQVERLMETALRQYNKVDVWINVWHWAFWGNSLIGLGYDCKYLNFDQVLNQELRLAGHKNMKVVTVEPRAVDTPFWHHAANYSGGTACMVAMNPP